MVKDDGLAAGKGVVVTHDRDEALAHAAECLAKPGSRVVIEDFLDGPEVSLFALSDGVDAVPLLPAQDFKRVGDGDEGPNTGGMGAYSPLPWAPPDLVEEVMERVARPTIAEMTRRGTPFAGVLYVGLALTSKGLRVVEFNARFGDPETQVVLARLATPLAGVLLAAATGTLGALPPLDWATPPRSPSSSRRAATRHGPLRRPDHGHRGRRGAARRARPARGDRAAARAPTPTIDGAHLVSPAGGCCPSSASGRTSLRPGPRPTPGSSRSTCRTRTTATTSPPRPRTTPAGLSPAA